MCTDRSIGKDVPKKTAHLNFYIIKLSWHLKKNTTEFNYHKKGDHKVLVISGSMLQ